MYSFFKKAVRGAAFLNFYQYFIWKKTKKRTFQKSRSGSGFFELLPIFYLEKSSKKHTLFLFQKFLCFKHLLFYFRRTNIK
jgi:hypothetical protein